MADISLLQEGYMEDADEGNFEQIDGSLSAIADIETLSPFQRIQKYAQSANIYDRQMVSRVVVELFLTAPVDALAEDLPKIMEIITGLGENDELLVRSDLLEQIPNLAAQALECSVRLPALNNIFGEYLLPLVVRNLGAYDAHICDTAHATLFRLLEKAFITRDQAERQVCPAILALSKVDSVKDLNGKVITLMIKLVPLLGPEITERVFLKRFAELCSNKLFYMRKVCATHFGEFCSVVGRDAFEQVLLPTYIELCGDEIWGVRKECAEIILSVSCACSSAVRRSILAPVFVKLLRDDTRWVRMAAFHSLGPFISTFADPTITSLSYNNRGELVLVNNTGNEFRLSSPTGSSLSANEYQQFLDFVGNAFVEPDKSKPKEENEQAEIEIMNNIDDATGELKTACEVSNAVDNQEEDSNIKEIVETIYRNWVSTNSNEEEEEEAASSSCNENNVINTRNKPCDKCGDTNDRINVINEKLERVSLEEHSFGDSSSIETTLSNENLSSTNSEEKDLGDSSNREATSNDEALSSIGSNSNKKIDIKIEDDCLDHFNSYNFWRFSPELPLDPHIVDAGRSPSKEMKIETDHTVRNLDALYYTITFDNTGSPKINGYEENACFQDEDEPDQQVPRMLIDHFVSMTDPHLAQDTDSDMAYHCAYSLPAVALTLGSKNWHLLKNTVDSLAADLQYKVRKTVACSLHELALILGPDIATNSLTPLFDGFVKDLDEVRVGVLNNLARFLELITPAQRSVCLPRLTDFLRTDNEWNWRFRQELAGQLLSAVALFRPADTAKHLAGIARELLSDKVAAVRQVALLLTTEILKHISSERILTSRLLVGLAESFAHSKKWKRRQTFALLCSELLTAQAIPLEQFASDVMPHLLDLSWDPVANVRLVVARTIATNIITNEYFCNPNSQNYDGLETVLRRLQTDKDRDVRHNAGMIEKTETPEFSFIENNVL